MRPLPDECVRHPGPPERSRRDWERPATDGLSCYFCRWVFHPVRTGGEDEVGKMVRDRDAFACDHPDCPECSGPVMTRRQVLDCRCDHCEEDDRDSGFVA